MAEQAPYPNAPITEALIDLRVTQEQDFSMDDLAKIQELVADRYPNQSTEYVYSGQIYVEEAGDPLKTEATHQSSGFRFTSQDGRQIFYARLDGFAFSIRAPYDRWAPFRDEARRLWGLYRSATRVKSITRAAVRYVNQLNIPGEHVELDEYLRTSPEVSPDYTHGQLAGFFLQLQLWVVSRSSVGGWEWQHGEQLFDLPDVVRQPRRHRWRTLDPAAPITGLFGALDPQAL